MAETPLTGARYLIDPERADARTRTGVLVIGSGIAGLTAALHCSREHDVVLVTKAALTETSTWYAQGGIAGAVGEADSVELHVADTLVVGQGLCDESVVRAVVGEAPEALESLLGFGVRFDLAERGGVALALEGGHSLPRVLHSGDRTGAAIQAALTKTLISRARIRVLEHRFLTDLLADGGRVAGGCFLDTRTGRCELIEADATVLATGGAGQAYRVTTNPLVATGDGVAAAWRAGAVVRDMEFVQFHPTALDHDAAPRFLVSEALRGEGAYLLDCDEKRFMPQAHPLAELAPRDVVSREIERVMARCGRRNVWLDARHLGEATLRARFPNIWRACADAGFDLARDLLPVAPAAHYLVGGVAVDVDGRTSLPGLYAAGEVGASGLHGANRLASNSLLEGLVFSRRIARALACGPEGHSLAAPRRDGLSRSGSAAVWGVTGGSIDVASSRGRLQSVSTDALGMSRTAEGLSSAREAIEELAASACAPADAASSELANLLTVGWLIASSADARRESRGCHARLDHPARDDGRWCGHIAHRRGGGLWFEPLTGYGEECRVLAT